MNSKTHQTSASACPGRCIVCRLTVPVPCASFQSPVSSVPLPAPPSCVPEKTESVGQELPFSVLYRRVSCVFTSISSPVKSPPPPWLRRAGDHGGSSVTLLCAPSPRFPSFSVCPSVLASSPCFTGCPCAFRIMSCPSYTLNHGFYQAYDTLSLGRPRCPASDEPSGRLGAAIPHPRGCSLCPAPLPSLTLRLTLHPRAPPSPGFSHTALPVPECKCPPGWKTLG